MKSSTQTIRTEAATPRSGTPGEVFTAFLKLGVTSFGGPIAHLGYFRDELVLRRKWIDEAGYADLVALCQFLPGPASSQVGFALGLLRAGPLGALAAWTAFTLPSAILLLLLAMVAASIEGPVGTGLLHGLKIVAVAVVGQAVWGMAKSLAPDRQRASIALVGIICVVFVAGAFGQILALALGAIAGLCFCRSEAARQASHLAFRVPKSVGYIALATFALLLAFLPVFAAMAGSQGLSLFDAFYRAGALVFGGGHVVLPLLQSAVISSGWVTEDAFIAGYGATQAVPGPLFTFAAYLGAVVGPQPNGIAGAVIALVAIFLPGMLLLVGALPFWEGFRKHLLAQAAMRGANAAVVGILGAALYDPVWTSAIFMPKDFALALTGFILLTVWKTPPWIVVVICAIGGVLLALS
ncbi:MULTISPECIES: chromate efflux transporter [Rhizobium/Agrobacterium group]|uniref:chromate efflux transporter n=1 Tax=Rhizobium/Agrobacterium group TaxID=227290 RepID=UPI0003F1EF4A|nr:MULTISPECIES: chromate efflux transporter [Rhizobium/Agrobacterium group]AHK02891.1 chromate transport protein ChrA [Agrobacterium tumefaciens LBA4213 (Ach5)]AKC08685.1 chromate transport protein [Agrobacterium tumefaciens]AYM17827.1 chromate transporter [Agrobacterium tumefaciens]AYM69126.1 chromate transporter [Agrobacterium tumefaciens]NIB58116.1 chromate efflux transporter [Agrobacterium tumefaciens]